MKSYFADVIPIGNSFQLDHTSALPRPLEVLLGLGMSVSCLLELKKCWLKEIGIQEMSDNPLFTEKCNILENNKNVYF